MAPVGLKGAGHARPRARDLQTDRMSLRTAISSGRADTPCRRTMPARKEMHMKTRSLILAAVGVYLFTLAAGADDWPGWRGPQRTGISKETGLLKAWPKDGPKLLKVS
jgi:hypothetical protein